MICNRVPRVSLPRMRGAAQASLYDNGPCDVMSPITVLVWKVGEMFLGPGPLMIQYVAL